MRNEGLPQTLLAGGAITKSRIVKFGANDQTVVQSDAAGDSHIGVADSLGQPEAGQTIDVIIDGVALVEYGGNVNAGALLTADASGRAIAATAAAGANVRVIGVAMLGGVSGDIGSVRLAPGSFQG